MEEKLFASLMTAAPEADLVTLREQAALELAPYRSRMQAVQDRQVEQQFLHKRLLEKYGLPRLSLFYMSPGMRLEIEKAIYGGAGLAGPRWERWRARRYLCRSRCRVNS